ncbi:hypothetical protein K501DRAFT_263838 [Backusella circina FSU 941]|nr:hypothetical protein K501DRAFT_263838 [Backusella circina FSU 941]
MGLKPHTIALISTAVVAAFGIGYLVYFDQKRRSDPDFKKRLKRERKLNAKKEKVAKEEEVATVEELVKEVLKAVSKEEFPESAEDKEKYFMEQVGIGEELCKQGEAYYDQSVIHFYKALKIYPAPLELIMIYQKTVPEKVFRIVVNIMALEQQQRQAGFYEQFPPAETKLKLKEVEDKSGHQLVATDDFAPDTVLYTETPLISALHPQLEASHCNVCMKKLQQESVDCSNCNLVKFCSEACQKQGTSQYHQFLCTNNKLNTDEKQVGFLNFAKNNNLMYPQMIAQFLSSMVAEELEKNEQGKNASPYSSWDHIERMKSSEVEPSKESADEANTIKELLVSKVNGIDTFLTDEIYLLLKGKLNANSFAVPTSSEDMNQETFCEPIRKLGDQSTLGAALYKISTYVGSSNEEEPNIKFEFDNNTNLIKAVALKEIKNGDVIEARYS